MFFSLDEANEAIRPLLAEFNARPFKKIKGSRAELFEQLDQPALKALPPEPYEYADWKVGARVGLDYMVEYEGCFYMVPYNLVDQHVDVRATANTVEVFFKIGGWQVMSACTAKDSAQSIATSCQPPISIIPSGRQPD